MKRDVTDCNAVKHQRCPELHPRLRIQCGLPLGHAGSHQNGHNVRPWEHDPERLAPEEVEMLYGEPVEGQKPSC